MRMKYLVLIGIAAITIASVASCTKSKPQLTTAQMLESHTWYLKYELVNNVNRHAACDLSEELTFSKDSTGNHYYGILCDTSQPTNISFHWYVEDYEPQWTVLSSTLYSSYIGGKMDSSTVLKITQLTADSMRMLGTIPPGQAYIAIYTSKK